MSASVGVSPKHACRCADRSRAASPSVSKPASIQCRYHAFFASSGTFGVCFRYFSTRRLLSGWISHAICSATARIRAIDRLLRQQRRLRMSFLEIFDDRERLLQRRVAVDPRRHDRIRVQRAVRVLQLLAAVAQHVHGDIVERQLLQVQGDPHAVRRGTAEIAVKLHGMSLVVVFGRRRHGRGAAGAHRRDSRVRAAPRLAGGSRTRAIPGHSSPLSAARCRPPAPPDDRFPRSRRRSVPVRPLHQIGRGRRTRAVRRGHVRLYRAMLDARVSDVELGAI